MARFPFNFLCVFFLFTVLSAAEEFQRSAAVAEPEVFVRSGPGTEYYPTAKLQLGDRVEVFYEDGNWCAVRPPVGSFSWISAKYVDILSGNIGSVNTDGLASRVGSDPSLYNGELCNTVQVKLKKGEKVLIISKTETPENPASPLWYKIAPPSGEFRWIQKDSLIEKAAMPPVNSVHGGSITRVVYENEQTPPIKLTPPAKQAIPVPVPGASGGQTLPANSPQVPETLCVENPEFQKVFEELKAETRNVLTRPAEDWVFQVLIDRANELFKIAPTDNDMEKVYNVLESLQRTRNVRQEIAVRRQYRTSISQPLTPAAVRTYPAFASNSGAPKPLKEITNEQEAVFPAAVKTAYSSEIARVASNPNVPRTDVPVPLIPKEEFDITGKLGAFEPLPKGHPPYAVVNGKDEVICLITPADGADLKPLLGKQVGINGILGVYEKKGQLNRRHITALEVKAL
ncbi:MAG: SH3 domain-containing protein [Planctomycetaceae bacterium]|jgi:uncharacterized protein YraI|nr:SH3 domain-containing protein [Planctomycetaceae bacterium]